MPHIASSAPAAMPAGPLSMLVYRSRAVQPMAPDALNRLAHAAQRRNRTERLTGLVVYDESRFFQWLEGPQESLERVMRSINDDRRHDEIEVLDQGPTATRTFGNWAMQLATRAPNARPSRDAMEPPDEVLAALHRAPSRASDLLAKLAPGARDSAGIEAVVRERVIPALLARHRAGLVRPTQPGPADPAELARRLLAGQCDEVESTLRRARAASPSLAALHTTLIEPAARHLGDLWMDDACSEVEVTLALCQLQGLLATLDPGAPSFGQSALVMPALGEGHLLGAALAAAALRDTGWAVRTAYPANDRAIASAVNAEPCARLHLALSPAFRREDALPRLTATIRAARAAGGKRLAISVGGRIFAEGVDASAVGADLVGASG